MNISIASIRLCKKTSYMISWCFIPLCPNILLKGGKTFFGTKIGQKQEKVFANSAILWHSSKISLLWKFLVDTTFFVTIRWSINCPMTKRWRKSKDLPFLTISMANFDINLPMNNGWARTRLLNFCNNNKHILLTFCV